MQNLRFLGTLPGATLAMARYTRDLVMSSGTYNYYISGYFGSFHYCSHSTTRRSTPSKFMTPWGTSIQIEEIP
jgi:hypothetical protein